MVQYSLADLESDAKLNEENEDIDITSFLTTTDDNLISSISNIIRNQRYLLFAEQALSTEIDILSMVDNNEAIDISNRMPILFDPHCHGEQLNSISALLGKLPISIDIKNVNKKCQVEFSNDSSLKQLQRDIERDRILINGNLLIGANIGLDAVLTAVKSAIDQIIYECNLYMPDSFKKNDICLSILQKACRTNSGGIAYATLQSLIQNDENNFVIVPASHLAPPIRLRISIGQFSEEIDSNEINSFKSLLQKRMGIKDKNLDFISNQHFNRWGLKAVVESTTYFTIKAFDQEGNGFDSTQQNNSLIKTIYKCCGCLAMDSLVTTESNFFIQSELVNIFHV